MSIVAGDIRESNGARGWRGFGKTYVPRGCHSPVVRIGGSTYSKRPFEPQVRELQEAGFDYWEIDLAWREPGPEIEKEAMALAEGLPIETAHLPPPRFTREDQARFQRALDYTALAGPKIFN